MYAYQKANKIYNQENAASHSSIINRRMNFIDRLSEFYFYEFY